MSDMAGLLWAVAVWCLGAIFGLLCGWRWGQASATPAVRESDIPVHRGRTIPVVAPGPGIAGASHGLNWHPIGHAPVAWSDAPTQTLDLGAGLYMTWSDTPTQTRHGVSGQALDGHRGNCQRVADALEHGRLDGPCSCDYGPPVVRAD